MELHQRFGEILKECSPSSLAPLTQFVTLYCYVCLRNNQKLINIEFVYEIFIIRKMR